MSTNIHGDGKNYNKLILGQLWKNEMLPSEISDVWWGCDFQICLNDLKILWVRDTIMYNIIISGTCNRSFSTRYRAKRNCFLITLVEKWSKLILFGRNFYDARNFWLKKFVDYRRGTETVRNCYRNVHMCWHHFTIGCGAVIFN